jgi:hypothetical protein
MDPLTIGVHVRNSTATHSQMPPMHFSGESVLFTRVDCFRVARNPPRIDAKCGDHFLQADFSLLIAAMISTRESRPQRR